MGASLWDQVLIGLATQIIGTALWSLIIQLWNCMIKHIKPQTEVEESAPDQPLPHGDAAAHANGVPDLEMGNGYGPAEGRQSMAEPDLELEMMNGGEGIEHFSDQAVHTPVNKFPVTITRDAARGVLVRVEMDVPRSQQQEEAAE